MMRTLGWPQRKVQHEGHHSLASQAGPLCTVPNVEVQLDEDGFNLR
jgi:hypothetical protein